MPNKRIHVNKTKLRRFAMQLYFSGDAKRYISQAKLGGSTSTTRKDFSFGRPLHTTINIPNGTRYPTRIIAAQELFANPDVAAGMARLEKYMDADKRNKTLSISE